VKWAGISRIEKFKQITSELKKKGADMMLISALDDIGWTFNLRGADVECNPVALAYGIVGTKGAKLFIELSKLTEEAKVELFNDGVELYHYNQFYEVLNNLSGKSIFFDPDRSNSLIVQTVVEKNKLLEGLSVPALLKACKNNAEIEGMKKAHLTDGLALLSFQLWLEDELENGSVTEYDVAMKLEEYRSKRGGYVGTSFFPIVGYEDHGAIVHFRVTPESANTLKQEGILLFDSGGQYEFGTTDITRTIALGPVSDKMKKDFTLVLKGMINLSRIKFPKGTVGCHLDVLARQALWNENQNYGHGTGHGVGAFMNVHEGPASIRPDLNSQGIRLGNIFSNEPGMYREGEYGIRIENLVYCVEDKKTEFGDFMRFETLTKYPIDTRLIEKSLLSDEEVKWLNEYHQSVLTVLSHFTNSDEHQLLKRLTQPI
jgi:Xaa-Pro aminopeptidase